LEEMMDVRTNASMTRATTVVRRVAVFGLAMLATINAAHT
jgi:hypothetical protein